MTPAFVCFCRHQLRSDWNRLDTATSWASAPPYSVSATWTSGRPCSARRSARDAIGDADVSPEQPGGRHCGGGRGVVHHEACAAQPAGLSDSCDAARRSGGCCYGSGCEQQADLHVHPAQAADGECEHSSTAVRSDPPSDGCHVGEPDFGGGDDVAAPRSPSTSQPPGSQARRHFADVALDAAQGHHAAPSGRSKPARAVYCIVPASIDARFLDVSSSQPPGRD
jgi:hypothetical protein